MRREGKVIEGRGADSFLRIRKATCSIIEKERERKRDRKREREKAGNRTLIERQRRIFDVGSRFTQVDASDRSADEHVDDNVSVI